MSSTSRKLKVVAIVGPTASGKSTLAMELAEAFHGEIISADSRQIYRGMDIGTAKPGLAEMAEVPHHLINIKEINEEYSVAQYKEDAIAAIGSIESHGKLPIMVGGTGLYIKVVLENLHIPSVQSDMELRKKLEGELHEKGLPFLFAKLVALDPEAESVVDPNNPRRVVRALEVALVTGEPFTAQRKKQEPLFDALVIGIDLPPEVLRERINARIDEMVEKGLVQEVKSLLKIFGADPIAFDAIGYREIIDHLKGRTSLEKTVAEMKMNSWHYAKRQMTWFRKDSTVHWIKNPTEASSLISNFVQKAP